MWTLRRAGNTMAQNLPVADGSHDHVLKRVDYIKHRNTHARFGGLGWGYPQPPGAKDNGFPCANITIHRHVRD
jgi:hypothetical protein